MEIPCGSVSLASDAVTSVAQVAWFLSLAWKLTHVTGTAKKTKKKKKGTCFTSQVLAFKGDPGLLITLKITVQAQGKCFFIPLAS